eukprot:snap_masked-scaffold_43-processed-gene-0.26-mRNA-1 protein AED:0.10 eAED:0.10 QI:0/-1/0/1/-1/1/1/0/197
MFRGRKAYPCSSKHTFKKHIEYCQKLHKEKLQRIKPSIDNKEPVKPSHYKKNKKRELEMEENFSKIEKENKLLLQKISEIMDKSFIEKIQDPYASNHPRTLNRSFRKRELQRITKTNREILKRIEKRSGVYNKKEWEKSRKIQEKLVESICEYKPCRKGKEKKHKKKKIPQGFLVPRLPSCNLEDIEKIDLENTQEN